MAERLALPEFTRSLRGFASARALGTREHDLVFGPLVAARRSAARVLAPEARAAAFDADRLRRGLADAIIGIAKDRAGADASRRRALEACLEEAATPAWRALDALAVAAATLRAAREATREATRADAWDAWCAAVQELFDAADSFWLSLDDVAPRRGAFGRGIGSAVKGAFRAPGAALVVTAALALGTLGSATAAAQHVTLRVSGVRADSLLAAGFDVVGAEPGAVIVVADTRDRARLTALGLSPTEMRAQRALTRADLQTSTTVYRSYDDSARGIRVWVDSIVRANPRVSVDTIGRSYQGRPMLMLKVGPRGDSPQRPNVLFIATYHAREWAATETALRLVKYLASAPGTDARRDSLVQARDIWIMPVANPDGYQYTFSNDRLWRKTRSPQAGGAIGVDMNRNHSVNWGLDNQGSSPDPQSDIFRGPARASEAETRAIEAWHALYPPVAAASYHSFAGLLLFPPGSVYGAVPADLPVYRTLAGTNVRSAVTDRLPGSLRAAYAPGEGWMLYTTNGEYTDFASSRFGTLAFTPELTSGYSAQGYYGFEFPDDESLLERLFQDNLPFALDLLDAARDPAAFASANTGRHTPRFGIESASPEIRLTVPAADAPAAALSTVGPVSFRLDSTAGGRYTRRVVSVPVTRPSAFRVSAGGATANFRVLLVAGAEPADAGWTMSGFRLDSLTTRAGAYCWFGTSGTLRSPTVTVPADIDTVSLAYWTMHSGSGFTAEPSGRVEASTDGGTSWATVGIQRGFGPVWYTDVVTLGGIRGKTVSFRFTANGMPWRLDEIALVGHGAVTTTTATDAKELRPSENPVRAASVRLAWPFGKSAGDITVFDFSGREVWHRQVTAGETATWDVQADGVANGVYLAIARSGSRVSRLKLFVARRSP